MLQEVPSQVAALLARGDPASKPDRASRRADSRHLKRAKRFHGYRDPCRGQQNVHGQGSRMN